MLHSIQRLGFDKPDHSFWQILIVCSGKDFLVYGEQFLRSCEACSPGLRVVVGISDKDEKAQELLQNVSQQLYATTVYEFEFASDFQASSNEVALYSTASWLFGHSKHALLILSVEFTVVEDLTLLPAVLQNCDLGAHTIRINEGGHRIAYSQPLWLKHTPKTFRLLEFIKKHINSTTAPGPVSEVELIKKVILKESSKLKTGCIPEFYRDKKLCENSYILRRPLSQVKGDAKRLSELAQKIEFTRNTPKNLVLFPLQDIGTKQPLDDNGYQTRISRLSRPGRVGWRVMARLISQSAQSAGVFTRILPVAQWEVTQELIDRLDFAEQLFIPHKTYKQLPIDNATFYMQEYLSEIFTCSSTGWGPSASWSSSDAFKNFPIDPRLEEFKAELKAQKKTKAPQKNQKQQSLPEFDVLAVLQVPEDEALTLHAKCTLDDFIEDMVKLSEKESLKVLFRKHPLDQTDFYEKARKTWQNEHLLFTNSGHIHDVLLEAQCIAVINSGVGFEAMLMGKPVLAFGRAIYDQAVSLVSEKGILTSYQHAISENSDLRTKRYDQFLSWFLYRTSFKLDETSFDKLPVDDGAAQPIENPVYHFYQNEMKLTSQRAKKVEFKKSKSSGLSFSDIFDKSQKSLKKAKKSIKKKYYHEAVNHSKGLFMPYFNTELLAGKRVCLVGNAGKLLESEAADFIDSHDIVIRMNLGCPYIVKKGMTLQPDYEKYIYGIFTDGRSSQAEEYTVLDPNTPVAILNEYTAVPAIGIKSDIWSCSTADRARQLFFAPVFNTQNVAPHPSLHHLSSKFILAHKVQRLPRIYTKKLQMKLSAEPTSGIIWIEFLRQANLAELSLVGFDFNQSRHIVRKGLSLLEATGRYRHNPQRERNYVINCVLPAHKNIRLF
ncbi:Capsule polysaccharide biosynthesis protein [Pseudovibrio sp. Ad46]|uniref:glycosyltransferase family 29 protein n=1 Tax=unclassified Pseudovibrio TaxID=2627060 RepID=UPI0007B2E2A6|nr:MULTISPECIES: glycosyltransferase family 29 protein [unclassified Pseudovibrio]KZK78851.1 Capsule polysaccharide biosynthesis protein [Pseudovibrio sp. Ad46]KZK93673.1 Capsule polysaccharide biosynthesis protein [Pseudovibrio sp. Ad5]